MKQKNASLTNVLNLTESVRIPHNKIWYDKSLPDKTRDNGLMKRVVIRESDVQNAIRLRENRPNKSLLGAVVIGESLQDKIWNELISMFNENYIPFHDVLIIRGRYIQIIKREDITPSLSPGNTKIIKQGKDYQINAHVFDLPAGSTCPAAKHCKVAVNHLNNDMIQRVQVFEKGLKYKCFAANSEARQIEVYFRRIVNMLFVEFATQEEIESALQALININQTNLLRIHGSGDFFKKKYFNAYVSLASNNSEIMFYGYTKMLPFKLELDSLNLDNFGLIYSDGGVYDNQALELNVNKACVVTGQDYSDLGNGFAVENRTGESIEFACVDKENDFQFILSGESLALHLH